VNAKKLTVIGVVVALITVFFVGMKTYQNRVQAAQDEHVRADPSRLIRSHSAVIGPKDAPVTIVEFFDPACEACRAFYPIVKDLMAQYPQDVRLVIRYAPFHPQSDVAAKLLEAAREQNMYERVMEAVLAAQPFWADHAKPNVEIAFQAAQIVGLDLARAREAVSRSSMDALLRQDVEDLKALQVTKTPTFFVNGRSLPSFGPEQLASLVADEVARSKK